MVTSLSGRRPRVAVVGRYYNKQGGVSNVMAQLAARAAASGTYDITVVSHEFLDLDGTEKFEAQRLPMLRRPPWLEVPTFGRFARSWVAESGFDLVHVHDPQMRGGDLYTAHSCFAEYVAVRRSQLSTPGRVASHFHPRIRTVLSAERRAYAEAPSVVAVSGSVAEQINRHHPRIQPASHVYNGVDVERYRSVDRDEAHRWLNGLVGRNLTEKLKLLFVGYEFDRKRLHVAINALAELNGDAELIVAGKGPIDQYRAVAENAGVADRVHFLGHVPKIEWALNAADIFVFPTRYEAASLAILEALAAGLPVVTTDVAMAREVLTDHENAILTPNTESHEPTAAALVELAGSADLRERLGRSAARLASNYSWDAIWKSYDSIYRMHLGL